MTDLSINQPAQTDGRRSASFKLAKRRYAMGLVWLSTTEKDSLDKVARSEAKAHKADLFVTRRSDSGANIGIGLKADGLQAGAVAAAAVIGDQIKGSFCAVFPVDGGWWFVAQRDDLITPHGDAFYDSEDAARARMIEAISEGDWARRIAPAEWGLAETDALDAAEMLMLAKAPRLRTLNALTTYLVPVIIAMAVAAGLFVGIQQYLKWEEEKVAADALAAQQALLAQQAALDAAKEKFDAPWPKAPAAAAAIHVCAEGFAKVEPVAPGWAAASISCKLTSDGKADMAMKWQRMYGLASWLDSWLQHNYDAEIAAATAFDLKGDRAETKFTTGSLAGRGAETVLDRRTATIRFISLAQGLGADLKIGKFDIPAPDEDEDPKDWKAPPYISVTWTMKTRGIDGWDRQLSMIPGLTVDSINFNPSENGYELKGDLYVQY